MTRNVALLAHINAVMFKVLCIEINTSVKNKLHNAMPWIQTPPTQIATEGVYRSVHQHKRNRNTGQCIVVEYVLHAAALLGKLGGTGYRLDPGKTAPDNVSIRGRGLG